MPDIYTDLLASAVATYRTASNGFHPAPNAAAIVDAINGFDQPFGALAAAIAKQKSGAYSPPDTYVTASNEILQAIAARRGTLSAAINAAATADDKKAKTGATLDVQSNLQKAKAQQTADTDLLAAVDDIIRHARSDATSAQPSDDSGSDHGGGSNSISQMVADEIAEISGQDSEEDGP